MKYALIFALCIMAFALPLVSAESTSVTIKYLSGHEITLNVLNPITESIEDTLVKNTNADGKAVFTIETDSTFKLLAQIKKDGNLIKSKDFGNTTYSAGGEIELNALSPGEKLPTITGSVISTNASNNLTNANNSAINSTIANQTIGTNSTLNDSLSEENQNESESKNKVNFSLPKIPKIPNYVYYIIGGVIVLIVLFIVGKKVIPDLIDGVSNILKKEGKRNNENLEDKELLKAERKMKELQDEIWRIKNKSKVVKEAEQRYLEAKEEYEKVKKRYG